MNDRLLSALSMARGAGKLKIGFEAAKDAVFEGAPLVVLASDMAERTKRGAAQFCEDAAELLPIARTQDDIAEKFGWRFGIAAVTDENFADLVKQEAQREQEDHR